MGPATKQAQTSGLKWQPKASKAAPTASKIQSAPATAPVAESMSPVIKAQKFPGLAKAVLTTNQNRRRNSDDEETCMESEEVSYCSSGDESWKSHEASSQNGRAAGKQLLSLLQGGDDAAQAPTESGKTKLSCGAAAFCPGRAAPSNAQHAPKTQNDKLGELLGHLREKLDASTDPLELAPKRYSTFDPMKQVASPTPSSKSEDKEEKASVSPTSKPKRTPLSVKAAAFQPRPFVGGSSFAPPGAFGQPWMDTSGFQLTFSTEMPPCSVSLPTMDASQEQGAQQFTPLPFESLLGDYEVSNGILVAKCSDGLAAPGNAEPEQSPVSTELSAEDDNGASGSSAEDDNNPCASSPLSTCSSSIHFTPSIPNQKISWADLSDDEDDCPWVKLANAPPEDRLD
eukprot:gnl/MRDRNA2_/MRDRNA2_71638_c0_seq1.p1 gnl/MRDRNA2_/MRDRNA2_71638_c0~~gnl/MRDRNA2_/MRDRNA2_71638_c0_seq1.p1  ORF type:complete len:399 (-),score=86.08 gnl/MRDRNA2_/MRDRNA2_71638_c0_seq1:15-1211(-)